MAGFAAAGGPDNRRPDSDLFPITARFGLGVIVFSPLQQGLLTAKYLLEQRPGLDDEREIRAALSGNLCRCTGYQNIVDAVRDAANVRAPEEA